MMNGLVWGTTRAQMVLENLDNKTRAYMKEELDFDRVHGGPYLGKSLSAHGRRVYPGLLEQAIEKGTPSSFAAALRKPGVLVPDARRHAAEMLAEGELNRYYIRGVCQRAIEDGLSIEVYRARPVAQARPQSEARIGARPSPRALLDDLRENQGPKKPRLGIPGGPNSGLSVRLVRGRR